jgi:hypothetical protein
VDFLFEARALPMGVFGFERLGFSLQRLLMVAAQEAGCQLKMALVSSDGQVTGRVFGSPRAARKCRRILESYGLGSFRLVAAP